MLLWWVLTYAITVRIWPETGCGEMTYPVTPTNQGLQTFEYPHAPFLAICDVTTRFY
jgi:hypothetical protein